MSVSYRNRNEGLVDKNGKKRKPNWEYRFYIAPQGGKRVRVEKCGFSRKADAVAAGTAAYNQYLTDGYYDKKKKISVSDMLDKWIENRCEKRCKFTTIENYRNIVKNVICPVLGGYYLHNLTLEVLQSFFDGLSSKYTKGYLETVKATMSGAMRYARRMGYCSRNELVDVELPAGEEEEEEEPLSSEEIKRIFSRFDEYSHHYVSLYLGYHFGLRSSEIYAVTWDDVNFAKRELWVSHQLLFDNEKKKHVLTLPKYKSRRCLYIDSEALEYLKRLKKFQEKQKKLFGDGEEFSYLSQYNYVSKQYTPGCKTVNFLTSNIRGSFIAPRSRFYVSKIIKNELGIERFHYHLLRHTHASELLAMNMNLKEIQQRLGHKDVLTTSRVYLHATQKSSEESKQLLEQMYKEA